MHSFVSDSICFDNVRLNVVQTEFYPNASFNMRTFRFNIDGSATKSQEQIVMCSIHLDPVNEISQEQPIECSCYTQTECEERDHLRGLQKLIKLFRFPLKFIIKDRTSCFKADIPIFLKMNLEMGHHSQSLIHLVSFFSDRRLTDFLIRYFRWFY